MQPSSISTITWSIQDETFAYSLLVVGFLVAMILTKATQYNNLAVPLPRCKRAPSKPILPVATPFNALHFLRGKKDKQEQEDFASVPVQQTQPDLYQMSARSRRPIKI